jgi:DNA-binding NarL/FixJ family response regulator
LISAPVFCPRFVGRQRELTFLIERRRDLAQAHGGFVLVGGDAGIGKSRLVREFLDRTGKSRGRVAVGRCRPFTTAPYEPLTELLATLAPAAPQLIPAQTQDEQLRSIAGAFTTAADKHAIVGIIEDLHWSDSGTLAVLALLAERLATTRMLLVATFRANELGPQHPHYIAFGTLLRSRVVASVTLAPLATEDMRDFIDAALQTAAHTVPPDVRRNVTDVAEGNPFFTEELLRDVVDNALLQQVERSLPTTIHAAILERIQPLTAADRAILTQAAIIGRRFDVNVLAHTLDMDVAAILPALQRSRGLQIVEETAVPTTFRFRHALTHEAISDQLLAAQRQPLHRRIALALEAQSASNAAPDALAYHWWAAGDRAKALEYGERGGDAAQALHAYADSIACYTRTLSLLDLRDRDAARIRFKIGVSCGRSGLVDRALEELRQAWQFYQTATDDASFVFRVARSMAIAIYNDGRTRESIAFLRRAIDVIDRCGDRRVSEHARLTLASYLVDSGFIEETLVLLRVVNAEAFVDDMPMTLLFWQTMGRVGELQGDVDGIRAAADHICASGDDPAHAYAAIEALKELTTAGLIVGETAVARRCMRRALESCHAIKLTTGAYGTLLVESAMERLLAGAFAEARSLVAQGLPLLGEFKADRHDAVLAALAVGSVLDDRELLGYEPDAAFIDEVFATDRSSSYGPLAAVYAQLLAARGENAAACRLLSRAVEAALSALQLTRSFPLVVVAAQLCDRAGAGAVRTVCARSLGSGPAPKAAAELAEAILLVRFGDAASAIAPARSAAAGFAAIGWPVYEALALEIAGAVDGARVIRERIGYRCGAPQHVDPAEGSNDPALTSRELEVARHVASGGTNREIAAALSVSVSLVEKYLTSIYGKLAIRSRSQLTAYLLARDNERQRSTG